MSFTDELGAAIWHQVVPMAVGSKIGGEARLYGYAIKESTGAAPAEVDLLNGADAGGDLVVPITLTAGQSARDWFGPQGVVMEGGIFANVTAGAVKGAIFVGKNF